MPVGKAYPENPCTLVLGVSKAQMDDRRLKAREALGEHTAEPSEDELRVSGTECSSKPLPNKHFRLLLRDMRQFKRYGFDRLHRSWLYLAYLTGQTAEAEIIRGGL